MKKFSVADYLQQKIINSNSSGKIAAQVLPGAASKIAVPSQNQCNTGAVSSCNGSPVVAMNKRAIYAVNPQGQPVIPQNLPCGMGIEETVSVQLDMTGQGVLLNKIPVVLFDEAGYHKAKNAIAANAPANTLYVNAAAANLYPSWVSGLCGHAFYFNAVKIDVSIAAGAAATAELQFQEMINIYRHNTRKVDSDQIEISNYVDTDAYQQNTRIVPLTDIKSRVDRTTAWVFNVYEGVKVTMTFFNAVMTNE